MAEEFYLDPESLKQTSDKVSRIGTTVDTAFTALQKTLDDMGDAWGDDEIGKSFGDNYAPQAQKVREALRGLVTAFGDVGQGIDDTSGQFQALDGANADQIAAADEDLRKQLDTPPPE